MGSRRSVRKVRGPLSERETVIRWDDEEKVVHIFTVSPKTLRYANKLGLKPSFKHTTGGTFYRIPLAEFRWRTRHKRKAKDEEAGRVQAVPTVR